MEEHFVPSPLWWLRSTSRYFFRWLQSTSRYSNPAPISGWPAYPLLAASKTEFNGDSCPIELWWKSVLSKSHLHAQLPKSPSLDRWQNTPDLNFYRCQSLWSKLTSCSIKIGQSVVILKNTRAQKYHLFNMVVYLVQKTWLAHFALFGAQRNPWSQFKVGSCKYCETLIASSLIWPGTEFYLQLIFCTLIIRSQWLHLLSSCSRKGFFTPRIASSHLQLGSVYR